MAKKLLNEDEMNDAVVTQDRPRDMSTTGDARDSLDERVVEVIDGPNAMSLVENLAFMEERVEVMVQDSTDKNAERVIYVSVGDRRQYFIRGEPQVVRRKFVEQLARAKETRFSQQHYKDANGDDAIRNIPHTAIKYPFSIIRDDNRRGADWLRQVLQQG